MNLKWIWFIATRYIFRKQKKSHTAVLSILGIATGVFALIVIIAVMNGFQMGFIESILEISSFHIRIGSLPAEKMEEARSALLTVQGIESAVPFNEFQGLARGRRSGQQGVLVRGLPHNTPELDAAMAQLLDFEDGFFDLNFRQDALLGAELARWLGVRTGDEVTLFSIPAIFSALESEDDSEDTPGSQVFTVTGIFRTGFYEYDTSWVIIGIDDVAAFSETGPVMGIKLNNRFHDRPMLDLARKSLEDREGFHEAVYSSWRDYNRSFFGALRTEKLFMFILVGLIFIVVGMNIYQTQRRSVLEHREEIGLLRAIGGGQKAVRLIFVCDGAILGFTGAAAGLILGLVTASNISVFFTAIEAVVNFFIPAVNVVAGLFRAGDVGDFAIFSPAVFYLKEIPSRIISGEVLLIFMFGFFSALLAAWFASRKVSGIQPAEVLRYDA